MNISKEFKLVVLIALFGATLAFSGGMYSDVFRGDEPTHLRMALQIYETKVRPAYDPCIHASDIAVRPNNIDMLWHGGLALSWWLTGSPSIVVAQLYQALWYMALIIGTYLLARKIYDAERAVYSALLVATIPACIGYTILLYHDVATATLAVFCFLFLLKERYVIAGLFIGLTILTKRTAYLFLPGITLWMFFRGIEYPVGNLLVSLKKLLLSAYEQGKFRNIIIVIVTCSLVVLPDVYYRMKTLHTATFAYSGVKPLYNANDIVAMFVHPSNIIWHPDMVVKELGILVLLGLAVYLWTRQYSREDLFAGMMIASYVCFYIIAIIGLWFVNNIGYVFQENQVENVTIFSYFPTVLSTTLSVRYFVPVFPFLAMLAAKGLFCWKRKEYRYAIILFCFLQAIGTTVYVWNFRKMPTDISDAYAFISKEIAPGKTFLCTYSALAVYTPHKTMWNSDNTMPDMNYLFWRANEKEAQKIFERYNIEYIFMEKNMIVDDSKFYNVSGFPRSFVEKRLPQYSFLDLIYSNQSVSVWKING